MFTAEDLKLFPPKNITAENIKEFLAGHYRAPEWIGFPEMRCGTGFAKGVDKYMDYYVLHCFGANERTAYEIKVSRSDYQREMKNPSKRKMALLFSNQFFFLAPKGIIKPEELPAECGLREVSWVNNQEEIDQTIESNVRWHGRLEPHPIPEFRWSLQMTTTVDAPHRDSMHPTWSFVAAMARRMTEGASQ